MSKFRDRVRRAFTGEKARPLDAGMYSYLAPANDPLNYRMHLRVEPGGEGLLILQASTVLHLNQSATEYAYHLLQRTADSQVAKEMSARYRVSENAALADFEQFKERINTLIESPDLDPVTFLDFERTQPYSEALGAPYRLDCALTYDLPKSSIVEVEAEAAPKKRVSKELSTAEWKAVIDKAWQAGIPHIIFTGGEATLRKDLVELLQHAEDLGMVTGLLTDGVKLGKTAYLKNLLDAGLDHAMIVLRPADKQNWDALASFSYWTEVLADDIFIAAHLTITQENTSQANALLDRLSGSGVSAVSLSANDAKMSAALQAARDHADFIDLPLVWDLPVPYSELNPVAIELDKNEGDHPQGAGKAWLYVEPDGDVLPGQGINHVLGNILTDDWAKIWKKARK